MTSQRRIADRLHLAGVLLLFAGLFAVLVVAIVHAATGYTKAFGVELLLALAGGALLCVLIGPPLPTAETVNRMSTRTFVLTLVTLALLTAGGATALWAANRAPAGGLVDPVCAVTVSGSPVPGAPSMLPAGTGTCQP